MKVLHIAGWDTTIYLFRLRLLNRLLAEGFTTHVASTPTTPEYVRAIELCGHQFHPVLIERKIRPLENLRAIYALIRLMRRERFDIVHTHTPIGGAIGRLAAILAGVPVVFYTTGGWYFHEHMRPWARQLIVMTERLLARKTDVIFSVNHEDVDTARQVGIRPRGDVVYSGSAGVDTQRFPLERKAEIRARVRHELGLDEGALVVGLVARLVWEKGIRDFLEVAAQLRNAGLSPIRYVVVGDGPIRREVESQARSMLIGDDVLWTGHRDDVPELMMAFDLYLFPSYREGLPVTVLEAMAAALPVVAYRIRGCREIVTPGENGELADLHDVEGLAAAVRGLLRDAGRRAAYGRTGRAVVEGEYRPELHVERQLVVYRQYAHRRGSEEGGAG